MHKTMHKTFHTQKLDQVVDLLAIHKSNPQRYPFLLESVANGDNNCDYSILFAFPQSQIRLDQLNALKCENIELNSSQFLAGLNEWFVNESQSNTVSNTAKINATKPNLPFNGGWFVYLGYELAEEIEPVLSLPKTSDISLPIAMAVRIPAAIIVDKRKNQTWLVAEPSFHHAITDMLLDVENLYADKACVDEKCVDKKESAVFQVNQIQEEQSQSYINSVKRIQQYIIEGDVFQVNISRNWTIDLENQIEAADVYKRLCKSNPAPFAGLMIAGKNAVISSSPERLVSVKNGIVETRPIAGTRPRQRNANGEIDHHADGLLKDELINHPKERAEHVMLIDLERNDLGRIAKPGSVVVDELMAVESYEHVHHIVSNVKGELANNVLPGDVIAAVFPGGTITGCPKVRCMEIIGELEASPRQAYTGAMGYINIDGEMDFNILIRTIILTGKQLHIRAGAGIVAYSDPEKELEETRVKAKGMLNLVLDFALESGEK